MKKQKIWVSPMLKKELCEKFRCTEQTISIALNFKRDSILAREIRSYSMNRLHGIYLVY